MSKNRTNNQAGNGAPISRYAAKRQKPVPMTLTAREPDIHQWKEDGVDHIVISPFAETALGRALSLTSGSWIQSLSTKEKNIYLPFEIQFLGKFNTIEGLMAWLQLQGWHRVEEFRRVTGANLRDLRRAASSDGYEPKKIPNQQAIVALALFERILQNDVLLNAFRQNTLPFDAYSLNSNSFRREVHAWNNRWCVPMYEKIAEVFASEGIPQHYMDEDGITRLIEGFNPMYWRNSNDHSLFSGAVPQYQLDAARKKAAADAALRAAKELEIKVAADKARAANMVPSSTLTWIEPAPMFDNSATSAFIPSAPAPVVAPVVEPAAPVAETAASAGDQSTTAVTPMFAGLGDVIEDASPFQPN